MVKCVCFDIYTLKRKIIQLKCKIKTVFGRYEKRV